VRATAALATAAWSVQSSGTLAIHHDGTVERASARLPRVVRENALSIVLTALFVAFLAAQIVSGRAAYNHERADEGKPAVSLQTYLSSGHFIEALFENWESEFLQMGAFVLLSVKLRQKGSAESKPFDEPFATDEDPRGHRSDPEAPWPVRRGGIILKCYEHSLSLAFFVLFGLSFSLHAIGGNMAENERRLARGDVPESLLEFLGSSEFWFQSFQNWQSEFLAVLAIVTLTIFLRERGSPQSKPVHEGHSKTGD